MSWFKRRPRVKEQSKQTPHHTSPLAEKALEQMKDKVRPLKAVPKPDK